MCELKAALSPVSYLVSWCIKALNFWSAALELFTVFKNRV